MTETLTILLKITLMLFMVGNLLDLGLRLDLKVALRGFRDARFITLTVVWGFVLCPALGYLLAKAIPLPPPVAMGLILMTIGPGGPMLPLMVDKARGDLNFTATFTLLTTLGTVLFLPVMVPVLVQGLTVTTWMVAKPMLLFILLPLLIGVVIKVRGESFASSIQPFVNKGTKIDTLLMLILVFGVYGKGMLGTVGTFAAGAQFVFLFIVTAGSYWLSFGMPERQKSVLSIGVCCRQIGPALAPLYIAPNVDPLAIVTTGALGTITPIIAMLIAARIYAKRAGKTVEGGVA
jgi:BASS family bile acid:Na+ symporter